MPPYIYIIFLVAFGLCFYQFGFVTGLIIALFVIGFVALIRLPDDWNK